MVIGRIEEVTLAEALKIRGRKVEVFHFLIVLRRLHKFTIPAHQQ